MIPRGILFLFLICSLFSWTRLQAAEELKSVIDANGNIVVVWVSHNPSGCPELRINTKLAGGSWGVPESLALPTCSINTLRVGAIAVGSDIATVALWTAINGTRVSLFSVMRETSTDPWSSITQVSDTL